MYAYSCMHDHDEQVARHHARQAHFPSLFPPSPPIYLLALPGPSLVPSLLWPSLPFTPCSLSPVCLFFLLSLFFPLRPAPSWHVARYCSRICPLSAGWSSGLRLNLGHACCPAARGTPPWHPFPSCRLSTCMTSHLGLLQYSWVLDGVIARKLQATLHYRLLPRSLSLSLPLSPALCLPFGPSLFALPLTRMLHNNVQGTLSSPCPGPSCCCAHRALQPSGLPGPSIVCPLAPSVPLSRPLYLSPLLGSLFRFLSPRALLYP